MSLNQAKQTKQKESRPISNFKNAQDKNKQMLSQGLLDSKGRRVSDDNIAGQIEESKMLSVVRINVPGVIMDIKDIGSHSKATISGT